MGGTGHPTTRSERDVQVERWTRLGRLIDSTPEIDFAAIAEVLAGLRSYDLLGAREGEVVLAVWQRRIQDGIASLDLTPELEAGGGPWFSADAAGNLNEHWPGGVQRPVGAPDGRARPSSA